MQFLRVFVSVLAAIFVSLMVLFTVLDMFKQNAPVLTCKVEDVITVPSNATDEDLLKYITASDEEDGDLTDRIVVERQMYFLEKGVSNVIFSVCDSDNNTSKLSKNIKFEDYHSPEIELHNDLIIPVKYSLDFKNSVTVIDKFDGDISNRIKIISPSFNNLIAGQYDINFKVTNSFSDTCDITVKAIVTDEDYSAAQIKLSKYLIYIDKGETPDFSSYITSVINYNQLGYNTYHVSIDSTEFKPEEGVYNIYYSIKSGNDTVTKTRLIVIVRGE
ncbi:MAG: hypothetical protein IJO62_00155 [Clostridia bacterium]|nr:hypothetical protein [Clostridia bacterium]